MYLAIWFHFNIYRLTIVPLVCVIKYLLKLLVEWDANSHWLTFLCCGFSNVFSKRLHKRMQSYIGCICLTFLRCEFSNVSSNRLPVTMHSHIGCICLTFLRCEFLNVFSKSLHGMMHSHIGCICLTFVLSLIHI